MATTYALAMPQPRAQVPMHGTRAQLVLGGGDVEGALALAGCDRRAGTASYALRVDNQSEHPLRARMTCLQSRGNVVLAYPLDVQIAPYSRCETLLPVRLAEIGRYDRAIVEVSGGAVAFTLEAPAPPRRYPRSPWLGIGLPALALTFAASFAAALATPHIGLLAAPMRVFAGRSIDVPYAFAGWGTLEYALRTKDGRQLVAGLADAHQGTLHFNVPAGAGKDVVLAVNLTGPFGHQTRTQRIMLAPADARPAAPVAVPAPRISAFAVVTPVVHANGDVRLAYTTNARDGDVWLIDESGRLWARSPITPAGATTLKIPQGAAGLPMRAVLHARNGSADAVASVAFTVLPSALVTDQQATVARATPKAPVVNSLTLSADNAVPGQTITVAIDGAHGDATISLDDASGTSLEQGDIPSSQSAMTLTAPGVSAPTTYYVMANVTDGTGQQTIVRKLVVAPR